MWVSSSLSPFGLQLASFFDIRFPPLARPPHVLPVQLSPLSFLPSLTYFSLLLSFFSVGLWSFWVFWSAASSFFVCLLSVFYSLPFVHLVLFCSLECSFHYPSWSTLYGVSFIFILFFFTQTLQARLYEILRSLGIFTRPWRCRCPSVVSLVRHLCCLLYA